MPEFAGGFGKQFDGTQYTIPFSHYGALLPMPPRKALKWMQKVQHPSLSPKGPFVRIDQNPESVYVGGSTAKGI